MKNRVTSGWVTVTGPPRAICAWNVCRASSRASPARCRSAPRCRAGRVAWAYHAVSRSARRLVWPSTLVASAALSVEMLTKCSTPWPRGALEHVEGAETLVFQPSLGVALEHRQVLERRGVEDDVGAVRRRRRRSRRSRVADVGEHEVVAVEQARARRCESWTACSADSSRSSSDELGRTEAVHLAGTARSRSTRRRR